MPSNETCPLYLRERAVYARKEKLDARSSSNSPWGLLCTKANDPLKITKWVKSVALSNRLLTVNFRYAPLATKITWRCHMSRWVRLGLPIQIAPNPVFRHYRTR